MAQEPVPKLSDILAQKRTALATTRTHIAAERTLMAWIRTSISMIGFGFTIYKFFQYLREAEGFARGPVRSPRNLGLTLVAFGTIFLIAATFQHRSFLKKLGIQESPWSLTFLMALLLSLVGVLVFFSMFLGTGPF